jgi:RNA polymerase sigma-70 factor (ECF subfamily)
LFFCAGGVCADAVGGARRRRSFEVMLRRETTAPDPSGSVDAALLVHALEPQRREAFVLTQLVGLSYADAAEVARVPVGTIRSRVARARDDLQAQWGEAAG